MNILFDKEYLRQLYEEGTTSDKKFRFQPYVVRKYQARVKTLEMASSVEDLFPLHSLNYEVLKGDKAGISSIRVDDRYRLEFIVNGVRNESEIMVCNILELSNHYK